MSANQTWKFFRAGGFDQVNLSSGADIANLDQLDQKLWVALACPTTGLEFDAKTLALIDTDKDGRVSLLEAFRYAQRETKRVYDDASKLQTEHAQLDDDGSKQNTADPPARGGQGTLARRYFLDATPVTVAGGDAAVAALYRERFELEAQVDSVRARKVRMPADAYLADLERALVALARKAREIRTVEGRP